MRQLFYRNAQARDNLELFLVSAISTVLLVRFYLYLADYPQLGGGNFHIAHMLYGGLFMMAAIVINLSFLGVRSERLAALVGGIGFGLFIDELGKFITKDNDYLFRPTIGLIYAVFCVLYLTINFLSRRQQLTSQEYQLNALRQLEEAVINDMDHKEKSAMHDMLAKADPNNFITREIKSLLKRVRTVPTENGHLQRLRHKVMAGYLYFWKRRGSNRLVAFIFVLQAVVFVVVVLLAIYHNFNTIQDLFLGSDSYSSKLIIGQLVSSVVAALFVVIGAIQLPSSRVSALEWFRRAVLVNIFLTEFFIFCRIQFEALPGFIISLILLALLHFALDQERQGGGRKN